MSFYKLMKISILLGTGILIACSPEKTEINTTAEQQQSTNQIKIKMEGLKVYIDPVTGERLSKPPVDKTITTNSVDTPSSQESLNYSRPEGSGDYLQLDTTPAKAK